LHPPADQLVYQLKYRGWHALAEPMGERMARLRLPRDAEEEARIVVPVPTTATRLRERGYNQAERLAAVYARLTRRPLHPLLTRAGSTTTQTVLQPAARGANVAGAFRVAEQGGRQVVGEHLLLIDDVMTTGATVSECARALVDAGARCVTVITFARALDVRRLTTT
jgi:ComF family protein